MDAHQSTTNERRYEMAIYNRTKRAATSLGGKERKTIKVGSEVLESDLSYIKHNPLTMPKLYVLNSDEDYIEIEYICRGEKLIVSNARYLDPSKRNLAVTA